MDPPAGIKVREGLYYNAYFPGGALGMPPPLNDGQVEFEDGTPATASQMSKDVSTFLAWCSEPELEQRKLMGVQFVGILVVAAVLTGYMKRFKWSHLKSRKIEWRK
jgi:ubiquinol-cytochrome c reductase cytochrome c1 subunit